MYVKLYTKKGWIMEKGVTGRNLYFSFEFEGADLDKVYSKGNIYPVNLYEDGRVYGFKPAPENSDALFLIFDESTEDFVIKASLESKNEIFIFPKQGKMDI